MRKIDGFTLEDHNQSRVTAEKDGGDLAISVKGLARGSVGVNGSARLDLAMARRLTSELGRAVQLGFKEKDPHRKHTFEFADLDGVRVRGKPSNFPFEPVYCVFFEDLPHNDGAVLLGEDHAKDFIDGIASMWGVG